MRVFNKNITEQDVTSRHIVFEDKPFAKGRVLVSVERIGEGKDDGFEDLRPYLFRAKLVRPTLHSIELTEEGKKFLSWLKSR